MKALPTALAIVLIAVAPCRAVGSTLVVGVVHDQDGIAADGATVIARTRDATVGRATVGIDGTFALDAAQAPDELDVSCRFCASTRVPFVAGADPSIAIKRYRGLASDGPTDDDLAALPPQGLASAAQLVPFTVAVGGAITDRGLGLGRDASVFDSLPLYRRLDGTPLASAIPSGALAAVANVDRTLQFASSAPDASAAMLEPSDRFSGAVRTTGALATATAYDHTAANARFAGASYAVPFAGGALSTGAFADANHDVNFGGALARYVTTSRRFTSALSSGVVRSSAYGSPESDVAFDAHVTSLGPAGLTVGVAGRNSSGASPAGNGAQHDDRAYATALWTSARTTLGLGLIVAPQLRPSLDFARALGPNATARASLHDDVVAPALRDAAPFARSQLAEIALDVTDARRLSTGALAYSETLAGSARARVRGIGVRAAYQIAPRWLVRGWILRADAIDGDVPPAFGDAYAVRSSLSDRIRTSGAARFDRQTLWLTYEGYVRFDVIARADGLDASVAMRTPRYRFSLGTRRVRDRRELTLTLASPH